MNRSALLIIFVAHIAGCCNENSLSNALRNLNSLNASDRNKALQVIAQCGSRGESAVPRISQLMYDENVGVASSAAYALRKIDSKRAREALKRAERARAEAR
jgi:HEAT repeat protein